MLMSMNINRPTTVITDRRYLRLNTQEYRQFAKALSANCYLNKKKHFCKLKKAKTKKLQNLRYGIKKSTYLLKSLIWKEQLRLIEVELNKRKRKQRC